MARKTDDATILKMIEQGKKQKEIAKHFGVSPAAICKRLKRLRTSQAEPESFEKLTDKEKKFVLAKAEGKTHSQAALNSFECGSMESAKSIGSQLMKRNDIAIAICDIMQEQGLTKTYRVQKLKTHVDHPDPNVSLKGLDQSWKLDGAYTEKIVHAEVDINDIEERLREVTKEKIKIQKKARDNFIAKLRKELPDVSISTIKEMADSAISATEIASPGESEKIRQVMEDLGITDDITEAEIIIDDGAN